MDVVVGEELCGVACCMESGVVVLQYSALQRLMPEIKPQKKCFSIFKQYKNLNIMGCYGFCMIYSVDV